MLTWLGLTANKEPDAPYKIRNDDGNNYDSDDLVDVKNDVLGHDLLIS